MPDFAAQSEAGLRVGPILEDLARYKEERGAYPTDLDALFAHYPERKRSLVSNETGPVTWSINYERLSPQDYQLSFNHAHFDVRYRNGERASTYVNCWR
jgi:hypothetical protein